MNGIPHSPENWMVKVSCPKPSSPKTIHHNNLTTMKNLFKTLGCFAAWLFGFRLHYLLAVTNHPNPFYSPSWSQKIKNKKRK